MYGHIPWSSAAAIHTKSVKTISGAKNTKISTVDGILPAQWIRHQPDFSEKKKVEQIRH